MHSHLVFLCPRTGIVAIFLMLFFPNKVTMVKAGLMPSSSSTSALPHPPEQQPIIDHFLPVSRHTTPILAILTALASPSFRLPLQNSNHHLRSLSSGTSISVISVILFLFSVPLGHCGPLTGHPTRCPSHQTKKQKVTEPRPAAPKLWDALLFEWSAASSVGILKNLQLKRAFVQSAHSSRINCTYSVSFCDSDVV